MRQRQPAICAWCGSLRTNGAWYEGTGLPEMARALFSSSICPDCFAAVAPGVAYPDGSLQALPPPRPGRARATAAVQSPAPLACSLS
jgi:hypothetical protein